MTDIHQFDEIRPYFDYEVPDVLKRIVRERGFLNFVKTFFPEQSTKKIIQDLLKIKTIAEFQRHLVYPRSKNYSFQRIRTNILWARTS